MIKKFCYMCNDYTDHVVFVRSGKYNDFEYSRCKGLRNGKVCNYVEQL